MVCALVIVESVCLCKLCFLSRLGAKLNVAYWCHIFKNRKAKNVDATVCIQSYNYCTTKPTLMQMHWVTHNQQTTLCTSAC